MATLIIAPLAVKGSITQESYNQILSANSEGKRLVLHTRNHPTVKFITDSNLKYETLDELYETASDFDDLNERISKLLICGQDIVYAVLGRGIGGAQFHEIMQFAESTNTKVNILPSSGFAEAAS
ncbi:MAG: hypothetical protein GX802_05865, partial [Clostridiales bacterium]|nr:hypothetical protein [Clostridiales bacterium]